MNYKDELNKIENIKKELNYILSDSGCVGGNLDKKLKELAKKIGSSTLSNLPNRLGDDAWGAELIDNIYKTLTSLSSIAMAGATIEIAEASIEQAKHTRRLCLGTICLVLVTIASVILTFFLKSS